ncbi:esterase/lipase family protein [Nonomuraea thailandensis]|uniref:esterase/lipase family protein n=1 Tax=Nonomuraea thailandensis TaxID=1188745 RepID=UPI0020A37A49|nr:hypothetical protein [Nonomuraea thailandensis]
MRRPLAAAPNPTIVLVHGAWADASGWNGVIARLKSDGYPVLAPAVSPARSSWWATRTAARS